METTELTPAFGAVIESANDIDLLDVPRDEVIEPFMRYGAVLFRGFRVDDERFVRFTERFGSEFLVNGNITRENVSADGKTQTVNPGNGLIPPHAEMAYSPFRPEVLWFHCVRPSERGGATLLCDGSRIWLQMEHSTRELFCNNRLKYIFRNLPEQWLTMFLGAIEDQSGIDSIVFSNPGLTLATNIDQTVNVEYTVSAVNQTQFGACPAFANSVIVEDKSAHFENGSPISRALRMELFALACREAFYLRWRPGDVLIVDNSRIMHGREPFSDVGRKIHVRLCRVFAL